MLRWVWHIAKIFIILLVLLIISQIEIGGRTLENRFHDYVNSPSFKSGYGSVTGIFTDNFVARKIKGFFGSTYDKFSKNIPKAGQNLSLDDLNLVKKMNEAKEALEKHNAQYDEKSLEKILDGN